MTLNLDTFGELDLSGTDPSGQVGCMARRLAELSAQEQALLQQLAFVHRAQEIALQALDSFISS